MVRVLIEVGVYVRYLLQQGQTLLQAGPEHGNGCQTCAATSEAEGAACRC